MFQWDDFYLIIMVRSCLLLSRGHTILIGMWIKYNAQMIIQRPVALHNANLSYNIYILLYCIYMFLANRRIEWLMIVIVRL